MQTSLRSAERWTGSVVAAAGLVTWAGVLAVVLSDERTVPELADFRPSPQESLPTDRVLVVVPARNEEENVGATLRALAVQTLPNMEVIAVDDRSDDRTLARMRQAQREDPAGRIHVLQGSDPPPGWMGKPWACAQATEELDADWVLFLDADVRPEPWALAAAVRFARAAGRGGVTVFPDMEVGSAAERVVLPLAAAVMQTAIFPGWAARSPRTDVAVGVGGFLLIDAEVYRRIGGHGAVRGEVVDDLSLARRVKRDGGLLAWARGTDAVRLRPYPELAGLWNGWRKNAAHAWTVAPLLGFAAGMGLTGLVLAPWVGLRRRRTARLALAAQATALWRLGRVMDVPAPYALAAPAGMAFLAAVGTASAWDRLVVGEVRWRGRRVAVR